MRYSRFQMYVAWLFYLFESNWWKYFRFMGNVSVPLTFHSADMVLLHPALCWSSMYYSLTVLFAGYMYLFTSVLSRPFYSFLATFGMISRWRMKKRKNGRPRNGFVCRVYYNSFQQDKRKSQGRYVAEWGSSIWCSLDIAVPPPVTILSIWKAPSSFIDS